VPLYVWLPLAASGLVVGGTALFTLGRGLTAWRAFRRLRRKVFDGLSDVSHRVTRIERRLATAGESAARFDRARSELQDSLATAAVLAAALGEARAVVGRVTGLMPRT
jgi:hypothetical protein